MEKNRDEFQIFQIFNNRTRFIIFRLLMTGTHCNCEISALTGFSDNLVSHHLKVLQKAGLVQSARREDDSRWIYYSVNPVRIKEINCYMNDVFDPRQIGSRVPECPPPSTRK